MSIIDEARALLVEYADRNDAPWANTIQAIAARRLARAVVDLDAELQSAHDLAMRQASILDAVAVALRGEPPEGVRWDHSDLGERVTRLREAAGLPPHGKMQCLACDGSGDPSCGFCGDTGYVAVQP